MLDLRNFRSGFIGLAAVVVICAQAPAPQFVPSSKLTALVGGTGSLGMQVPERVLARLEDLLQDLARKQAGGVAATYARSESADLRGIRELGRQLLVALAGEHPQIKFEELVTRNPVFWMAERELAPGDVSLPYLVSMLAVLSHDYATASRSLALAQATLPLTPTVRAGYARPEAFLLMMDKLLLQGLPGAERLESISECEQAVAIARTRISRWPNRPVLVRALIDVEARYAELSAKENGHDELLAQRLGDRLGLTAEDVAYIRNHDPILAMGFNATAREWHSTSVLAQRWDRWIELSEPADAADVASAVEIYTQCGRADLAWLTWRCGCVLEGVVGRAESRRWLGWSETLLGVAEAKELQRITAENRRAGIASMVIENEGFSEAWTGDPRIHPWLAVKAERQLAVVDAMLSLYTPGTRYEGDYRLRRAQVLKDVGAVEGSRRELRRALVLLGNGPGIKLTEALLLTAERHFNEADALYEELLHDPAMAPLRRNRATNLFKAGNLSRAHDLYVALYRDKPDDGYMAIMADLTAQRQGRREAELLENAKEHLDSEAWTLQGVRYLRGEIDEARVLEFARKGTVLEILSNTCDVYFWLGEKALADGKKEEALKWLGRCVDTGSVTSTEYQIALDEVERLEADLGIKAKKREPRDSAFPQPT